MNWERIIDRQKWPLIGGTSPEDEGNGYHDRRSFDIPFNDINRSENVNSIIDSKAYSYFHELAIMVNPSFASDYGRSFQQSISLRNCTEGYRRTFNKYLGARNHQYDSTISDLIGRWGEILVHHGRLVLEFVTWKDRIDGEIYAFELKELQDINLIEKRRKFLYRSVIKDNQGKLQRIQMSIPKTKCIFIQWPMQLGGYKRHHNVRVELNQLARNQGNSMDLMSDPGSYLKLMDEDELKLNAIIYKWGTNHPIDGLNQFQVMLCLLRHKKTATLCRLEAIKVLKELVKFLNNAFKENADVTIDHQSLDISRAIEMENRWIKGELSFREANSYLSKS